MFITIQSLLAALFILNISTSTMSVSPEYCEEALKERKPEKVIEMSTKCEQSGILSEIDLLVLLQNRGVAYYELGNDDLALADFSKVIELKPIFYKTFLMRANILLKKGEYDLALKDVNKGIELAPENPIFYYGRARAYSGKGNNVKAIANYKRVIEIMGSHSYSAYNLSCIYARTNRTDEACYWFQESIKSGISEWDHIKQDSDLDNIRDLNCYKDIMKNK